MNDHCRFPIECMIATDNAEIDDSPKAAALRELQSVVFVDDFLPYLRGIPDNIHAALILHDRMARRMSGPIWHGRIPVMPISPTLRCGG